MTERGIAVGVVPVNAPEPEPEPEEAGRGRGLVHGLGARST